MGSGAVDQIPGREIRTEGRIRAGPGRSEGVDVAVLA